MKRRVELGVGWVLATASILFVALLAGFASGAVSTDPPTVNPYATRGDEPAKAEVVISGFSFGGTTEVAAGTEVTIRNEDGVSHTFTADDGAFDTGVIGGSETAVLVMSQPGTFTFFCAIHPSMTGTITVTG